MHQARLSVSADVCFHAKVHLLTLLAGVHFWVAGVIFVLGRARCSDQSGINYGAMLEQQPFSLQDTIDGVESLPGQFVLFQPVAEPKDGAFIGQASELFDLSELTAQRHIDKSLLHRWIRQGGAIVARSACQAWSARKTGVGGGF